MSRLRPIAASRIKAAVKAAEEAGLRVGAIELQPDGTIKVTAASETKIVVILSPLEQWEGRRGAR